MSRTVDIMSRAPIKHKAKVESEAMLYVKALCRASGTSLMAVCLALEIPYSHAHIAIFRDSYRGKAGEYHRQVLRYLQTRMRGGRGTQTFHAGIRKSTREREITS